MDVILLIVFCYVLAVRRVIRPRGRITASGEKVAPKFLGTAQD